MADHRRPPVLNIRFTASSRIRHGAKAFPRRPPESGRRDRGKFVSSQREKERGKAAPSIPQEARLFLSVETSFSLEWNGSFLRAYPKAHSDLFSLINAKPLRVLSAGIYLGEAKGKTLSHLKSWL